MSQYLIPQETPEERACLVGVKLPRSTIEETWENLRELEQLALTAGAEVVELMVQRRDRVDGATYIGKGKIESLGEILREKNANLVIFDDDLSPAQARNIENRLNVNVLDRTELILDIFSRGARTKQARLQVEIAQLNYALPRLKRLWEHLSRQAGGIGTRGPGETQLEVDRRQVRERIAHLKKELSKIGRRVGERRKRRMNAFNVTIVGYTNAGKSTLLNRLSNAGVLESGKLFSTLDSTSRRVELPEGEEIVLTDTIGFIRKLPTHLVASFRATLIDVEKADMLLHLVDLSCPSFEERIKIVNDVLGQVLGEPESPEGVPENIPTTLVFNKTDLAESSERISRAKKRHPLSIMISAADGTGMENLLERIKIQMEKNSFEAVITIPASEGKAIAFVEMSAKILERSLEEESMIFRVLIGKKNLGRIENMGKAKVTLSRPRESR